MRVFIGEPAAVAFDQRNLGIDSTPLRHQAAGQQHEKADVGDHKPRLVSFPGIADGCCGKNTDRQEGVKQRKPPGVPDTELHSLSSETTFNERAHTEHDRQQ